MNNVWDSLAKIHYYRLSDGRDVTFHKIFLPVIVGIIEERVGFKYFNVLDVGCGTGYLTGIISNYARSVLGIDSSKASIDIAINHNRNIKNVDFNHEDIEILSNSRKQAFDFAMSHLALHVIQDLELSLCNISACLKTGGRFLFSIPHPCFWALSQDVGTWNFKRINNYRYNEPSVQQNSINIDGNEFITPYFHRPIEFYFTALEKSGFAIEIIIEPFPGKELLQENHKKIWRFPRFMFMVCVKS